MRLLDEEYTRHPFLGVIKLTNWLKKQGYSHVGKRRVRRLLRLMGLMAIFPGPNLSRPAPGHKIYPHLLRGLAITRVNQVWSTDITYIRLKGSFVYLVAIIDWYLGIQPFRDQGWVPEGALKTHVATPTLFPF